MLEILDFNSDRKRMSVVVRDASNGAIVIYTKGADTMMEPRLNPEGSKAMLDATFKHMREFSLEGLRTLIVATAKLDEAKFEAWRGKFHEATCDLDEIGKRQAHEPNRIDELMDEVERGFDGSNCSARPRSRTGCRTACPRRCMTRGRGHQDLGAHRRQAGDGDQHRRRASCCSRRR